MNWDSIVTIISSGAGGAAVLKIVEHYFLPKDKKKEFDEKVRDELWDRIKNLEGRIDEQNRMILEVMRENATLKSDIERYKEENTLLRTELDKHIKDK